MSQRMFAKSFSLHGRIRRTEYALSVIIQIVCTLAIEFLATSRFGTEVYVLYFPVIGFMWAQGAKRCHDRGNSAWFQLIPFYGFVMLFGEGQYGENEYGPDPKGRDQGELPNPSRATVSCSSCKSDLELNDAERASGRFRCPICGNAGRV